MKAIVNPDAQFVGHPATIQSVVRAIDQSHRLIKMRDPEGIVSYKLQRFGKYAFQKDWQEPEWYPFGDDADGNPPIATENVPKLLADSRADQDFILDLPPLLAPEENA